MAESAYHNEALRRQRIIERKRDAQVRLLEGPQSNEMPGYGGADMKDTVLYSGPGHFEQSRITRQVRKKEEHLLRSTYNWLGTARDRKQYDHSRNGPVVASSWYGLKSELNGIGQCTPLTGKGHPVTFYDLQQIRYITPRP
ncbi:uncharacterized protein LOC127707419 isoform X4 [Mytilus californianus]|uniref:uncharacterized protein LOC127707419 isoform X4 n=1 Tax=Mytilus californianus TaxID=6549 RepID=UPI0022452E9E|nr:uncharacterized protein LOC127707419 isoform X4 [Mytilus californianus]